MNNEDNLSRPFTKEETIDNLLEVIYGYSQDTDRTDGERIARRVLVCIDGGELEIPSFELNAVLEDGDEDIAGELHSFLLKSDDKLKGMESEGIYKWNS